MKLYQGAHIPGAGHAYVNNCVSYCISGNKPWDDNEYI